MESTFTEVQVPAGCDSAPIDPRDLESGTPRCDGLHDVEEECWQKLEAFWGAEKQRHQLELPLYRSNTENQLQQQDFLSEPPVAVREANVPVNEPNNFLYIVRGEDINDVPTSYVVNGLQSHEFPVIGTFVDARVLPGFKYRVRVNRTQRMLFAGRALRLESIGRGYGKRITFEPAGSSLNANDNYFYSDTIAQGYGFSPIAIDVGDRFRVRHSASDEVCGELVVSELARPQVEVSSIVQKDGSVEKEIKVDFYAKFQSVSNRLLDRQLHWNKVRVSGLAALVKAAKSSEAVLERVVVENCPLAGYELVPPARACCEE